MLNPSRLNNDVEVAILMLAHDGVKNRCWSTWFQESASNRVGIVCYIHEKDERMSLPKSGSNNIFLASEECLDMDTAWGCSSLAFVSIRLLTEATQLFPNAARFILVSGRCLPLAAPSTLIAWSNRNPKSSVFWIGGGTHFDVVQGQMFNSDCPSWAPTPKPTGIKLLYSGGSKKGQKYPFHIQTHGQFWSITRGHSKKILEFPRMSTLMKLNELFSSTKLYKFHASAKRNVMIGPDEHWFMLILKLQGVEDSEIIHLRNYVQLHEKQLDPSPITWKSLDEPRTVWINNPLSPTYAMPAVLTLRQAIQSCVKFRLTTPNSCLFFFRKTEMEDQNFKPWTVNTEGPDVVKLIQFRQARRLPYVMFCSTRHRGILQSSTRQLLNNYSNLHHKSLTKPVTKDKRERERIRTRKQRHFNKTLRQTQINFMNGEILSF